MNLTCKICGAVWNNPQMSTHVLLDWLEASRAAVEAGCQQCGATGHSLQLLGVTQATFALRAEPCLYQQPLPCREKHPLDPDYWCRDCCRIMRFNPPQGVGGWTTYREYYDGFVRGLKEKHGQSV